MLVILVLPLEELNSSGGISVIKMISVIAFGCAIINYMVLRPREPLVRTPQNGLILLFLLAALLSTFVANDPSTVLGRSSKLLRVLALYFFAINLIRSEKYFKLALWMFLIGGFICTLYGFFDPAQAGERFQGALGQPNGYGLTMTPRIPIGLALLIVERNFWKKIFLLSMLAAMSYGIILSASRGALLSVSLALILFAILQKNWGGWITSISLIFVLGLFVMPENIKARVGIIDAPTTSELGNSIDRRLTYQIYSAELFQQHPILGIGLDGFAEAYAQSEYRFLLRTRELRAAHNTYFEIATGTGLVGLLPFLGILAWALYLAWKYSRSIYRRINFDLAITSTGLFAALGGYYLGMLFGSRQYEKTLWFLLALPVVIQVLIHSREKTVYQTEQIIESHQGVHE